MDSALFIGLSKKEAQNLAEKCNLIFRLIRVDDKQMFSFPEKFQKDRICVEIENNKIVKADLF